MIIFYKIYVDKLRTYLLFLLLLLLSVGFSVSLCLLNLVSVSPTCINFSIPPPPLPLLPCCQCLSISLSFSVPNFVSVSVSVFSMSHLVSCPPSVNLPILFSISPPSILCVFLCLCLYLYLCLYVSLCLYQSPLSLPALLNSLFLYLSLPPLPLGSASSRLSHLVCPNLITKHPDVDLNSL